jgi:hypothetical protein
MELLLPELSADAPADAPEAAKPAAVDGEEPPQGSHAPDDESVTGGAGGNGHAEGEAEALPAEAPQADAPQVTSKGLPKRTPRITTPSAPPRQRSASVDADALRRRLGGFRQGAQAGYRDVEAEITANTEHSTGGPAEEARS